MPFASIKIQHQEGENEVDKDAPGIGEETPVAGEGK